MKDETVILHMSREDFQESINKIRRDVAQAMIDSLLCQEPSEFALSVARVLDSVLCIEIGLTAPLSQSADVTPATH